VNFELVLSPMIKGIKQFRSADKPQITGGPELIFHPNPKQIGTLAMGT
jgi:hypothetical protein